MKPNTWAELPTQKRIDQSWSGNETPMERSPSRTHDQLHQQLLAAAYGDAPAVCLCRTPTTAAPLRLAIGKRGDRFYLARYPNSGQQHDPRCTFYERPLLTSGIRCYAPSVAETSKDGTKSVSVSFPFGLTTPQKTASSGQQLQSMSMQGLTDLLFESAALNFASPGGEQRNWYSVSTRLQSAAETIHIGSHPLSAHFQAIPTKPGTRDKARAQTLFSVPGRSLILLARLYGYTTPNNYGSVALKLGGVIDLGLNLWCNLSASKLAALQARYPRQHSLLDAQKGAPTFVIACFVGTIATQDPSKASPHKRFVVDDIALLEVTRGFIPVSSEGEAQLAADLAAGGRTFARPLRYELPAEEPLAHFELLDTGRTAPYPLEVYTDPNVSYMKTRHAKQAYFNANYPGRYWLWDTTQDASMPALPPAEAAT